MAAEPAKAGLTIPMTAMDEAGSLLGPGDIPIEALIEPDEIRQFAESIAELTQMECSLVRYSPEKPESFMEGGRYQLVRAPICKALNGIRSGEFPQCVLDVHTAGHAAMDAGEPLEAGCIGGDGTLYACPIILQYQGRDYPKLAVVAAAEETTGFHFANRLGKILGCSAAEAEELMCQTDKLALNAAQLKRIRAIMALQAKAFSRQISDRYQEFQSLTVILRQREQLAAAYGELDREFKTVGEIQRQLVPEQPPEIEGLATATYYSPARRAGGDYYDFFCGPDGKWSIIIADVSGHGPPAAVIMAMVRAIMHGWEMDLPYPAKVMARINDYLFENSQSDQFMTSFYGVLDASAGIMTYNSAAHNPPLVFDSRKHEVHELTTETSFPLGILEDATFDQFELKIREGDIVLLYTDGITDVINAEEELFGLGRLCDALSAAAPLGVEAVRDAIVDKMAAHAGDILPPDDRTLVIFQRL